MSLLLWALIIGGVLVVAAVFMHRLDRMQRRARCVKTSAWQREHWQEKSERASAGRARLTASGLGAALNRSTNMIGSGRPLFSSVSSSVNPWLR